MGKRVLDLGLVLSAIFGLRACSTGEFNDLECDPAEYQAQCLTPKAYMYCKSGQLISVVCGGERVCKSEGASVACRDPFVRKAVTQGDKQ